MDAGVITLLREQEADMLDDGMPYETIGDRDTWLYNTVTYAPTPFMHIAMREMLAALVRVYGYYGHWLCHEIGRDNLRDPCFVERIGLRYYNQLYEAILAALPEDEREDHVR